MGTHFYRSRRILNNKANETTAREDSISLVRIPGPDIFFAEMALIFPIPAAYPAIPGLAWQHLARHTLPKAARVMSPC
jgi:hypothetical protein